MSETLTVKSADVSLSVRVEGAGHLPWLVLSNSLATDLSLWDRQLADLARLRRIVRYDTRGHGDSSAPAGPYSFDTLTADVIAIMDQLGIERADILGLSLGGMTALGLGLDHASRVNTIICCCARADFPAPAISMWDDRIKAVRDGGMAAIAEGTLGRWFTPAALAEKPTYIDSTRAMILKTSVEGYCGCVAALKSLDYRRRLPDLNKPTLFIAGAEDQAASSAAMREMAAATPGAKFEEMTAASHIANIEQPERFNAAVCDFLRQG